MGNEQPHKSKTKTKTKNKNSKNLIIEQITCPFCKKLFNSSTTINALNYHIKLCGVKFIQINKECEIFPPSQDYELNELIYQNSKKYIALNIDKTQTMEQKTKNRKIKSRNKKSENKLGGRKRYLKFK